MIVRMNGPQAVHRFRSSLPGFVRPNEGQFRRAERKLKLPFNKAKDANDRPNTLVSMASRPVTIKVIEAKK